MNKYIVKTNKIKVCKIPKITLFLKSQGYNPNDFEYIRKTMDNYIFKYKNNKLVAMRY